MALWLFVLVVEKQERRNKKEETRNKKQETRDENREGRNLGETKDKFGVDFKLWKSNHYKKE